MLGDRALDHLRQIAVAPDLSGTKYTVLGRIAKGGMGTVWLAEDRELGRRIALKTMNDTLVSSSITSRFLREATVIAGLEHPGIIPIHDVGTLPDGRVYYAMKLVSGRTLHELALGDAPRAGLLRVFQRTCEAMAFAHSRGVIHRDLKPENVMVGAFGEALVMDWGLAKVVSKGAGPSRETAAQDTTQDPAKSETVLLPPGAGKEPRDVGDTAHGTVLGTPSYMAPEQARGEVDRLDARTDVHALGAILYFALTRRPPFAGKTVPEVLRAVKEAAPVPPRTLDPTVPRALEAICLRALEKDPARRYPSADELSADVGRYLDGERVSAHRETILERAGRVLARHRVLALLVGAYVLTRLVVLLAARR